MQMTNVILKKNIEAASSIVLLGHVRPDGDCVGSVLALYRYIRNSAPDKAVAVYLERPAEKFSGLSGFTDIITDPDTEKKAELAVALDVSDHDRLGAFAPLFDHAQATLNIDHHVTNPGFAAETVCVPEASSTCEVLFELIGEEAVDREIAACLYTGIITDTGVFKYAQTSARTMQIAGILMEKGIDFGEMIDSAYYRKTWTQNRILGKALVKSVRALGGRLIYSIITLEDKAEFGADSMDLDGIAEQLRLTEGAECAVLCGETEPGVFKLSLRSLEEVNVSEIALSYGGGGHIRAAGCTVPGRAEEIMEEICKRVEAQCSC